MKRERELHIDDRLQAWLDGELPRAEAEELGRHVEKCARCSQSLEDSKAVVEALRSDRDAEPLRHMWPAVRARIVPSARRRIGFAFGLATSLAAAAGLVIGIMLGASGGTQPATTASSQYSETSLLGGETLASLDDIYVSAFEESDQSAQ
jgi:anti-sigma factor RsiW